MKQLKFLPAIGVAFLLLFSSCGGDDTKTTDTTATDSTAATTTTPPASTIDTTAQTIMVVKHKVADFAKFKIAYDGHDSMRLASGIHSYVIGRGVLDSNMVLVAVKADDAEKAKAFAKNPSLKAAMQKAGVTGTPDIMIHTIRYQDQSENMSLLRSMTHFTVKDWAGWKTAFESNRQLRADNGVTDRAYGHDVDDTKKVTLVVAINDSAKADAFWNSDIIKQKRVESGVVGEVKRFVYRVVQRY